MVIDIDVKLTPFIVLNRFMTISKICYNMSGLSHCLSEEEFYVILSFLRCLESVIGQKKLLILTFVNKYNVKHEYNLIALMAQPVSRA